MPYSNTAQNLNKIDNQLQSSLISIRFRHATGEVERKKMLLCIAAQTFDINYTLYAGSGLQKISKNENGFWKFKCLFRKFNLSPDWFLNFECRFKKFQRHIL